MPIVLPSGHAVTAAEWKVLLSLVQPLYVRKAANESVLSSTALQDDDELFLTVEASAVYEILTLVNYSSGTTEDFKYDFTGPAGSDFFYAPNSGDPADNDQFTLTNYGLATFGTGVSTNGDSLAAANPHVMYPYGLLRTSVTAGTFRFRFAQNTSGAGTAAICRAGSFMVARRVQ